MNAMTNDERNALLEEIAVMLNDQPHGISRGIRQHACGSCGLTDEEYQATTDFNRGVEASAAAVRRMKTSPPISTMT